MDFNRIEFAAFSDQGPVRGKNQDNLYCPGGKYLPEKNEGTRKIWSGESFRFEESCFSVFDGMGGEKAGETASYIAASMLNEMISRRRSSGITGNVPTFLKSFCYCSNDEIDLYRKEKKYRAMGTTAALFMAAEDAVYTCNLGDTRIYRLSDGVLSQLSVDHVQKSPLFRNAPLTQYLGVPSSEMQIEPAMTSVEYKRGDRYLICSDGVWRTADKNMLEKILNTQEDCAKCLQRLRSWVADNDGTDNATAILVYLL